jgi:excisionase family DNA binding protein
MNPLDIFPNAANVSDRAEPVPPAHAPLVLTINSAAERLGISRSLMYALIQSGEVESVRIGRLRRVPTEALSEYVTALRRSA